MKSDEIISTEDFLSDIFHSCALQAYIDTIRETGENPPDVELTRKKAYEYYEREKALEKK